MALICLNRERRDHTLQPTALVNETFLGMAKGRQPHWEDRLHFLAIAGRLMRQILVDYARRHQAGKRGGCLERTSFEDDLEFSADKSQELICLDHALCRLAERDERQCRIVEMKFFGGLEIEEIAEILQISSRTVKREWTLARAWLHREMTT
jgi:RNA polymerase sigma factor (TIGR02999 family)